MFHIPAHKSGTAGQIVNPLPSHKYRIQVKLGESWCNLVPTNGKPYEYDSEAEALAVIKAFWDDSAHDMRVVPG